MKKTETTTPLIRVSNVSNCFPRVDYLLLYPKIGKKRRPESRLWVLRDMTYVTESL